MKIDILNQEGKKLKSKIELSNNVFGIEPNDHCVYLAVKSEMAALRQGTSSSKTRAEVSGTGKKPWKQKGTGRARIGSTRNPSRVHGGSAFGPKPRNYNLKVNFKVKNLAKRSVLSSKYQNKKIIIIDKITLSNPKTKDFLAILKNLKVDSAKTTFLLKSIDENVFLSSRNLFKVSIVESNRASTYDMIDNEILILDQKTVEFFNNQSNGN
ncbi:MAG: 50S ribosomal protein L4 [Candidatus Marinimicrobia bacterium]|nr:50S ribosomal protein L4 [Candidatus Neomarinimicrobiota bacterium]